MGLKGESREIWRGIEGERQRGLNTKRPMLFFFGLPRKLSNHMGRQARTGDTVSVKSREMISIGAKHCHGGWEEGGKDDRKQNTLNEYDR
jgi:hypothetical protein